MSEESDLEKTESPSPRRVEQAREEGQVPQSRELGGFLVMATGFGSLWIMGSWFAERGMDVLRRGLTLGRAEAFDTAAMGSTFVELGWAAIFALIPFFVVLMVAALAGPFLIGGFNFAPKALVPDLGRMSPLKGFGRMFSTNGLGELVKAVLKAVLVASIAVLVISNEQAAIFALISQSPDVAMRSASGLISFSSVAIVSGMALIVAIDVPFQLWQYHKKLRMSKEEVRKEMRETEGDPQLKARVRSMQREMARRRMMSEVPNAQVVVTNPTHYSVALAYDEGRMRAPRVVAKGTGLIALRIREIAAEHNIPVLEAPPLARALCKHAELGDEIPSALYRAVAEVMAYVYQLNQFMAGKTRGRAPVVPTGLPVPAELDPGVGE